MSRFEDPAILVCSISGAVANRDQCPAIPYTPDEYAAEAKRAVDEGATMIHIHARSPDGLPSFEVEDFRNITDAILNEVDHESLVACGSARDLDLFDGHLALGTYTKEPASRRLD